MHKRTRWIIFILFTSTFLVSAPIIVLYTAGYRISLNNQRIEQTGALAVSTIPRGATISVDGFTASGKSPAVVQEVAPRKTTVQLTKLGYTSWEQAFNVASGQTTYLSAVLFSDAPALLATTFGAGRSFIDSPNGRYVAYLTQAVPPQKNKTALMIYDLVTKSERILGLVAEDAAKDKLSWLPDSDVIVLLDQGSPLYGYTVTGQAINKTDLPDVIKNASSTNISFLNNGKNVEIHTLTADADQLIALLPIGTYTTLEEDADYVLIKDARDTLYLISFASSEVTTLNVPCQTYDWLPNEHLLVWSDGLEVNTYDAERKIQTFITRQSDVITHLLWHPSTIDVFIQTATKIIAIDTNPYENGRVATKLIDLPDGTIEHAWLDSSAKNLYFTLSDKGDTALYQRPLVK